jgi:hypothetical protein
VLWKEGLPCSFLAEPPHLAVVGDQEAPPSPEPVQVTIHISNAAESGRHNVSVRRTRGSSWRFHAFYTAMREQLAALIGMKASSLSNYSPMVIRRAPASPSVAPAAGWERGIPIARAPPMPMLTDSPPSSSAASMGWESDVSAASMRFHAMCALGQREALMPLAGSPMEGAPCAPAPAAAAFAGSGGFSGSGSFNSGGFNGSVSFGSESREGSFVSRDGSFVSRDGSNCGSREGSFNSFRRRQRAPDAPLFATAPNAPWHR